MQAEMSIVAAGRHALERQRGIEAADHAFERQRAHLNVVRDPEVAAWLSNLVLPLEGSRARDVRFDDHVDVAEARALHVDGAAVHEDRASLGSAAKRRQQGSE